MAKAFDIMPRPTKVNESARVPKKTNLAIFIWIIIICLILILIINSIFSNKYQVKTTSSPIPTSKPSSLNDPTATPFENSSADQIPDYSAKNTQASNSASPAVTIDKSAINIKILNGSGVRGEADQAKADLEKEGFKISQIGTAKNTYSSSIIYYKDNKEAEAKLLTGYLQIEPELENNNQLVGEYDLLYVIGKK